MIMLKIIICDDDRFTQKWITELVAVTMKALNVEGTVVCYASSARELLNYMEKNQGGFLLLMDIDLGTGEINGIDLARVVKNKYPETKIVFITSHAEKSMYVLKSGAEPFGFIEKDSSRGRMIKEFAAVLSKLEIQGNSIPAEAEIALPIGYDETIQIPISRISYVETLKNIPHHICYHTIDGSQITVHDTISHAEELLGETFKQSHRSVLVNTQQVIGLDGNNLRLSNGELLPCSIGRKAAFLRKDK